MNLLIKEKINEEISDLKKQEKTAITLQSRAKQWLIIFFLIMILLTVLSRAADALTIAKVSVEFPKRNNLVFNFNGDGVIEAKTENTVGTIDNIRVEQVYVEQGQRVNEGDSLFMLNLQDIKDKIFLIQNDIERNNIKLKQEDVTGKNETISEEETAQIELNNKILDLETVINEQEYEVKIAEQNIEAAKEKLQKKEEQYNEALNKTSESLQKEKQDSFDTANFELEKTQLDYNEALKEAQREVQDLEKELDRLNNADTQGKVQYAIEQYNSVAENGSEEEIKAASDYLNKVLHGDGGIEEHQNNISDTKSKIDRAKEDVLLVKEKWEKEIKDKEEKLNKIKKDLDEIKNGTYDFESDIKAEQESVEAAKENLKDMERKLEEAKHIQAIKIETAQRNIKDAEIKLEQAKKKDKNIVQNEYNENKLANLRKESIKIDLKEKKIELKRLQQVLDADGLVFSPVDGVVSLVELKQGKRTSLENAVTISSKMEGYVYRGKIEKEKADYISIGDEMNVTLRGKEKGYPVKVEGLNFTSDDENAEITASMPELDFVPGMSAKFEMEKKTESYPLCIPIGAIKEDTRGTFVLVMREKDSILGKENIAARIDVEILDKDSSKAAVRGMLLGDDKIIVSSNKNIGEGDRIRVME